MFSLECSRSLSLNKQDNLVMYSKKPLLLLLIYYYVRMLHKPMNTRRVSSFRIYINDNAKLQHDDLVHALSYHSTIHVMIFC